MAISSARRNRARPIRLFRHLTDDTQIVRHLADTRIERAKGYASSNLAASRSSDSAGAKRRCAAASSRQFEERADALIRHCVSDGTPVATISPVVRQIARRGFRLLGPANPSRRPTSSEASVRRSPRDSRPVRARSAYRRREHRHLHQHHAAIEGGIGYAISRRGSTNVLAMGGFEALHAEPR